MQVVEARKARHDRDLASFIEDWNIQPCSTNVVQCNIVEQTSSALTNWTYFDNVSYRDFHHRKAIKTNSKFHWDQSRKIKNLTNNLVEKCKSDYYINLIN